MSPSRAERLLTTALLLALGIAVLLHVGGALTVFGMIHDEASSYLASTGHRGEYEMACQQGDYPIGQWVPVSEWRRFIEIEDHFVFERISRDLAASDRHPPLYFWLLHLWSLGFGDSTTAARMFGVVLNLGIAALLSAIVWRLVRERASALAAACLWLLSPTALKSALMIRQYTLFALLALTFAYVLWRYLNSERRGFHRGGLSPALALITLAGLLTHYHFMFVIAAGVLAFIAVYLKARRLDKLAGDLALVLAHLAISAALVFLLDAHYLQPILETAIGDSDSQLVASPPLTRRAWSARAPKLADVLERPIAYFVPEGSWHRFFTSPSIQLMTAAALILLAALAIYATARRSAGLPSVAECTDLRSTAAFMGIIMISFWGATVGLYLTGYSPPSAMSHYRYFAPVGVFIPVLLLALMHAPHLFRYRWPISTVLLTGMMASSTFTLLRETSHPSIEALRAISVGSRQVEKAAPDDHHYILVDNLVGGGIFALVPWLPEDSLIYYANRDALLSRPDEWLSKIKHEGGLYVPLDRERTGNIGKQAILDALQAVVSIEPLKGGRAYLLTPK